MLLSLFLSVLSPPEFSGTKDLTFDRRASGEKERKAILSNNL
jgi:hypothetical protein